MNARVLWASAAVGGTLVSVAWASPLGPTPVGLPPGPHYVWGIPACNPSVGWGWVEESVPRLYAMPRDLGRGVVDGPKGESVSSPAPVMRLFERPTCVNGQCPR